MLSLVRASLRPSLRAPRSFVHTSATLSAQAPAEGTTQPASPSSSSPAATAPRKASSVAAGTVLKGINFLKEGKDPVALEDEQYPMWLWDLLDEKKQKQKTTKPSNRQYHRKRNRDAIKGANFMRDKKT